jgi:hypothetical protein
VTHREDLTPVDRALAALAEEGFDGMAAAIGVLMNEVMKLERSAFLGAEPHERTAERRGYANGYKPTNVKTRVGAVGLQIPQVRDVEDGAAFYPQSRVLRGPPRRSESGAGHPVHGGGGQGSGGRYSPGVATIPYPSPRQAARRRYSRPRMIESPNGASCAAALDDQRSSSA